MTTGILLTAVRHIVVNEPLGTGLLLTNSTYLVNDSSIIHAAVSERLANAMGQLEYVFLLSNGYMLASSIPSERSTDPIPAINRWLAELHTLQLALWMVKDNSVHCEMAYLDCAPQTEELNVHSNFVGTTYTTANGIYESVTYSVVELEQARAYFRDFLDPILTPESEAQHPSIPRAATAHLLTSRVINPRGSSRLLRTIYFVNCARATDELSTKVSLYMTIFEILFSNDAAELSYKLALRVALFVGQDEAEARGVFSVIKKSYGLRSRFLHGDVIPPAAIAELGALVPAVDDLVRRVLCRLASDFETRQRLEGTKELRDSLFEDLVFRHRWSGA